MDDQTQSKNKKNNDEDAAEQPQDPKLPATGGGDWGGWGFSPLSFLSDLQKAAAVAAEEISRNAAAVAQTASKSIAELEKGAEDSKDGEGAEGSESDKESEDEDDKRRKSALDKLEKASDDSLLSQGLKVFDNSVETFASGAWSALGNALKGGTDLVHRLDRPGAAGSNAPSLLETGKAFTAKGMQVLEYVGKETLDLLISETGIEVEKAKKEGEKHNEEDQLSEEVTFDRCFYIYGGPELPPYNSPLTLLLSFLQTETKLRNMLLNMDDGEISNAFPHQNPASSSNNNNIPPALKRKRNLPGNPDPEAEVIALSPKTLMATNRFVCEICLKGFQRDQNLQLHRRGHNLPWKLKQRTSKEVRKRVYVCPEKTCVHHHPSRALGDLTGIKKHFCRKHGEKKWKCEKCSKRYAVQSDWKAHSKTCGTREYKCDCGTVFSRRDSFITHRAFCDALAEETAKVNATSNLNNSLGGNMGYTFMQQTPLGPTMATHFSSIFKPISCTEEETETGNNNHQTPRGLSLWMTQPQTSHPHETMSASTHMHHEIHNHHLGTTTNQGPIYSVGNGNPPPPPSNYQLNWVFGNKFSSNGNHQELTSTTSLPLVNNNNIVNDGAHNLISVPSLYSSQQQHQSHQTSASANMSATALLQKAAQIGTTSSTDPSFLGSLGLRSCNSPRQDHGNSNKFCGMYSSSSVVTTSHGCETENYSDDLSQMPPAKRRHVQSEESAWGQTRDFLGVGVANHLPPFINQRMDLI